LRQPWTRGGCVFERIAGRVALRVGPGGQQRPQYVDGFLSIVGLQDAELPECGATSMRLVQIARSRNQLLDQTGVMPHHRLCQFQGRSLKVSAAAELALFLNSLDGGRGRREQQQRRWKEQDDKGGNPQAIGSEQREGACCNHNGGHQQPVRPSIEKFP
jgi:hypothetical protein